MLTYADEEGELKVLFQEFEEMRQWLKHVEAIHTLLWFIEVASDNGAPLVRLASQVHVCARMRTYADVRWRTLTDADGC